MSAREFAPGVLAPDLDLGDKFDHEGETYVVTGVTGLSRKGGGGGWITARLFVPPPPPAAEPTAVPEAKAPMQLELASRTSNNPDFATACFAVSGPDAEVIPTGDIIPETDFADCMSHLLEH